MSRWWLPFSLCYLLDGAEESLHLVDTWMDGPDNWERLHSTVASTGQRTEEIASATETHKHRDRAGLAGRVWPSHLSGVTLFLGPETVDNTIDCRAPVHAADAIELAPSDGGRSRHRHRRGACRDRNVWPGPANSSWDSSNPAIRYAAITRSGLHASAPGLPMWEIAPGDRHGRTASSARKGRHRGPRCARPSCAPAARR
jgi:hypothetical protein